MQTTMATKPTGKFSHTRRVSTMQDKIDAINYVRAMCEKKWKITDGAIKNKFGVHYLVRRLIQNGILIRVGDPNEAGIYSQSGLYDFHAGGVTPQDISEMLWQLHGRVNGQPNPRPKASIQSMLALPKIDVPHAPPPVVAKIAAPQETDLAGNINEWLGMCERFNIVNSADFIAAQLKLSGYVK
jgi:hypothetical protein